VNLHTNKERGGCKFSEPYQAKLLMNDIYIPNALLPVIFGVMQTQFKMSCGVLKCIPYTSAWLW